MLSNQNVLIATKVVTEPLLSPQLREMCRKTIFGFSIAGKTSCHHMWRMATGLDNADLDRFELKNKILLSLKIEGS
jgi:hypothetical protein